MGFLCGPLFSSEVTSTREHMTIELFVCEDFSLSMPIKKMTLMSRCQFFNLSNFRPSWGAGLYRTIFSTFLSKCSFLYCCYWSFTHYRKQNMPPELCLDYIPIDRNYLSVRHLLGFIPGYSWSGCPMCSRIY